MKIKYGPQQLKLGAGSRNVGQVVFDTGSSYTYFTNEVYTSLLTTVSSCYHQKVLTFLLTIVNLCPYSCEPRSLNALQMV